MNTPKTIKDIEEYLETVSENYEVPFKCVKDYISVADEVPTLIEIIRILIPGASNPKLKEIEEKYLLSGYE